MKIAIDGPSGAGKSTLARMAANRLGFIYVDTGALYRCIGLFILRSNIQSTDRESVREALKNINIEMRYDADGVQHMFLNGEDVTNDIRTPRVSMAASDVSALPETREFLLDLQRDIADKHDVIMDGRDIGTVVLPNADVKVFLTASPGERAKRRCKELIEKGIDVVYQDVLNEIITRDSQDSSREIAPLKVAPDAVVLDTTNYTLNDSLERLIEIIRK